MPRHMTVELRAQLPQPQHAAAAYLQGELRYEWQARAGERAPHLAAPKMPARAA